MAETGWKTLSQIRPDIFVQWRASLKCAPKTRKEYHISANAFLNWLVQTDRLLVNPLAKVPHVETRGKQVRPSRAFTETNSGACSRWQGGGGLLTRCCCTRGSGRARSAR